jgi:AcrR family transcriptional regulator
LIRSLLELIERKPYDRLSIGEIVRNANVGRSTPFRHAGGHQAVFRTLMRGSGLELIIRDGQSVLSRKIEHRLRGVLSGRPEPSVGLPLLANTLAGGLPVM